MNANKTHYSVLIYQNILLVLFKIVVHFVLQMIRRSKNFNISIVNAGNDQIPKVKISVENSHPKLSILIDPQEFLPKLSLLKDEMMKLRTAIEAGRDYEVPERHDPLYLMFDNDFLLGNQRSICNLFLSSTDIFVTFKERLLIGLNICCTISRRMKKRKCRTSRMLPSLTTT